MTNLALLALACTTLSGCNILGVLGYKLSGPPTIQAKYEPEKMPMLVLVENSRNPATLRVDADRVARNVATELREHEAAPVVEPSALDDFRRAKGSAYGGMAINAVGRALGAEQVLYIDLIQLAVEPALASEMLKGRAEARVRVVDVAAGQTRWPLDASLGHPVVVETQYVRAGGADGVTEPAVRDRLHAMLADRIAKLFYDWKADSMDGGAEAFSE